MAFLNSAKHLENSNIRETDSLNSSRVRFSPFVKKIALLVKNKKKNFKMGGVLPSCLSLKFKRRRNAGERIVQ